MKYTTLKTALDAMSLPKAYYRTVPDGTAVPFVIWKISGSDNFPADNRVYKKRQTIEIQLYTAYKDFAVNEELEQTLDRLGVIWDYDEYDGADEGVIIGIYTFQDFIDD